MEEVGDTYRDSTTPPPSYHLSHLQDRINAIQESTKQCLDSATNDGPVTNLPELWVMFQEALHAKEHACLGLQDWVLQMKWLLIKACNDCIREGVENISAQTLLALLKSSQILTELVAEQLDRLVPKVLDDVDYCVELLINALRQVNKTTTRNRPNLSTVDPADFKFVFHDDSGPKVRLRGLKFGPEECNGLQRPWKIPGEWVLFRQFGIYHSDFLDAPVPALCLLTLPMNGEEPSVVILDQRWQRIARLPVEPPITQTRATRFHDGIINVQDGTSERSPVPHGKLAEFGNCRVEFTTEEDVALLCVISESVAEYTVNYEPQEDPYAIILALSLLIATKYEYTSILQSLATSSQQIIPGSNIPAVEQLVDQAKDLAMRFTRSELDPIPVGGPARSPTRTPKRSLFMWVARSDYKTIARLLLELKGEANGILREVNGTADEQINELMAKEFDEGSTPLQYAAYLGHLPTVVHLLEGGANVNSYPARRSGCTALQAAAGEGHLDVIKHLLQAGADVNAAAAEESGKTALQAAAAAGHLPVVHELLQAGADVNAAPAKFKGLSALVGGAMSGNEALVQSLLDAGADVKAELGEWGVYNSPLQAATALGHAGVVELLLGVGVNLNAIAPDFRGRTPLQAAAETGRESIVNRLIEAGADINAGAAKTHGVTALQAAASAGYKSIMQTLIAAGADLEARSSQDFQNDTYEYTTCRTALEAAATFGHEEIVKILLQAGVEVNGSVTEPSSSLTPLQAAAREGHEAVVNHLIEAGGLTGAPKGHCGGMALLAAVKKGHLNIVKRLLVAGVDLSGGGTPNYEASPLETAARLGHSEIVDVLLEGGADVNAVKRLSVICSAAFAGHSDIVDRLIRAGADANYRDEYGYTVMQEAASGGSVSVVRSLLQAGAGANEEAKRHGHTALYAAADQESVEIVEELLNAGADVNAPAHCFDDDDEHCSDIVRERTPKALKYEEDNASRRVDWGRGCRNIWGDTALCAAVTRRNLPIVRLLMNAGADANLVYHPMGKTAREVAIMSCAGSEILTLLGGTESE